MKKDIFRRPQRMTHKFGETEKIDDPLGGATFDFYEQHKRTRTTDLSRRGTPCTVQGYGEDRVFTAPRSPVQKPGGGLASVAGPAIDYAEMLARPMPVSSKKRVNHLKTDK